MGTPIKLKNMPPDELNAYTECEAEVLFNDGDSETWDDIQIKLNGEVKIEDHDGNIYYTEEELKAAGVQTIQFYLRADAVREIHIR